MHSIRNQINKEDQLWSEMANVVPLVVAKYASRKAIPNREKEDVEFFVLEKLLHKKDKIIGAFRGESAYRTYCIAVVNRMVCEIIRKESKHWYSIEDEPSSGNSLQSEKWDTEKELYLKTEIKRYKMAVKLFENYGRKEHLFFKYYFELNFSEKEIMDYATNKTEEVEKYLKVRTESKSAKFTQLSKVVNEVEQKDNKPDAVRIWLNKQMDTLINRLNMHGKTNYNKETLGILLEFAEIKNQ